MINIYLKKILTLLLSILKLNPVYAFYRDYRIYKKRITVRHAVKERPGVKTPISDYFYRRHLNLKHTVRVYNFLWRGLIIWFITFGLTMLIFVYVPLFYVGLSNFLILFLFCYFYICAWEIELCRRVDYYHFWLKRRLEYFIIMSTAGVSGILFIFYGPMFTLWNEDQYCDLDSVKLIKESYFNLNFERVWYYFSVFRKDLWVVAEDIVEKTLFVDYFFLSILFMLMLVLTYRIMDILDYEEIRFGRFNKFEYQTHGFKSPFVKFFYRYYKSCLSIILFLLLFVGFVCYIFLNNKTLELATIYPCFVSILHIKINLVLSLIYIILSAILILLIYFLNNERAYLISFFVILLFLFVCVFGYFCIDFTTTWEFILKWCTLENLLIVLEFIEKMNIWELIWEVIKSIFGI